MFLRLSNYELENRTFWSKLFGLKLVLMLILFCSAVIFPQNNYKIEEQTSIPGSVSGTINHGRVFKMASGSIYQVSGFPLELVLELSPDVNVFRTGSGYVLIIEGVKEPIECIQLKPPYSSSGGGQASQGTVMESNIDGEFQGWSGETIFKLRNGQIWQQASYAYTYSYKYCPRVMIYSSGGRYIMQVEGMDSTIPVVRLK